MTTTNPSSSEQLEEQLIEPTPAVEAEEEKALTPEEALAVQVEAYQELQNQHLRLAADFDNFRKRRLAELEQHRKYGAEPFASNLLPVLDNLDRAKQSLTETSESKVLYQGLLMMHQQLKQALEALGVKRMETVGQQFDPAIHEAVSQLAMPAAPENSVIAEQLAGYQLHDKVIRAAQVIVATNPE
ncbi:MAG: nucleotide exchange factor GrpE [Vampirovibrio sp.]|jgi:molecular chaperone GrpE|nr:nucleotide exchange factor GrpE [Vampirovibrio sp.]